MKNAELGSTYEVGIAKIGNFKGRIAITFGGRVKGCVILTHKNVLHIKVPTLQQQQQQAVAAAAVPLH
jgi:hypothetical protein